MLLSVKTVHCFNASFLYYHYFWSNPDFLHDKADIATSIRDTSLQLLTCFLSGISSDYKFNL